MVEGLFPRKCYYLKVSSYGSVILRNEEEPSCLLSVPWFFLQKKSPATELQVI